MSPRFTLGSEGYLGCCANFLTVIFGALSHSRFATKNIHS